MVLINDNSVVLKTGDPMPKFTLTDVTGKQFSSSQILKDITVIVFTCNHCPYAQAYEDRLIVLAKTFEPDAQFVFINSNDPTDYPEDSLEEMQARAKLKNYQFPYLHDVTQETARVYGALCTPHCFVFDKERKLRYKGRVDDDWRGLKIKNRNLYDALTALSNGGQPQVPEANAIGCSIKWKI